MEASIEPAASGVAMSDEAPSSTTIVRRPLSASQDETDDKSSEMGIKTPELQWKWTLESVTPLARRAPVTVRSEMAPSCVHSFVRSVAKLPDVKCVVVEDGEGHTVHITTFVESPTDEKRNQIYAIEAETIHANPNLVFDFHVRAAQEVSGNAALISGKHYYAIWGELDAQRK